MQHLRTLFFVISLLGSIFIGLTGISFVFAQGGGDNSEKLEEFLNKPPKGRTPSSSARELLPPYGFGAVKIQAEIEKVQIKEQGQVKRLKEWLRYGIASILAVILVIFQVLVFRVLSSHPDYTIRDMLNIMGLILIVFSIVLVVIIADTSEQITTAVGVLGTIAGYLFGSLNSGRSSDN